VSILDNRIMAFEKIVAMLPDKPNASAGITSEALKEWFDAATEELREQFNNVIDTLWGPEGTSNIGHGEGKLNSLIAEMSDVIADIMTTLIGKADIEYVNQVAASFVAGTLSPGSVTDTMLSDTAGQAKSRITALEDYNGPFIMERLNKDTEGIFTEIRHRRRSNGTLYRKTVLSGGTSPLYTNMTETYYEANGTTVKSQLTYYISYDDKGDVVMVDFEYPLGQ
jgi:hypothetical protein